MPTTEEKEPDSVYDRIKTASKNGQEPTDRLWGVVIVLTILVVCVGGLLLESRFFLSESERQSERLGYQRGAVDCLNLMVDDDRFFDMPDYCVSDQLIGYYPKPVCVRLFPNNQRCGIWQRN